MGILRSPVNKLYMLCDVTTVNPFEAWHWMQLKMNSHTHGNNCKHVTSTAFGLFLVSVYYCVFLSWSVIHRVRICTAYLVKQHIYFIVLAIHFLLPTLTNNLPHSRTIYHIQELFTTSTKYLPHFRTNNTLRTIRPFYELYIYTTYTLSHMY